MNLEDNLVEPWSEEDKARIRGICTAKYQEDGGCSKCPFDTPPGSDRYLCCEAWLKAHPAEARKIMDEMEGEAGQ